MLNFDSLSQGPIHLKCYECGKVGHRAGECPKCKYREREATGKNRKYVRIEERVVSAVTPKGDRGTGQGADNGECRVESLRKQLREAELEVELRKKSATMHDVTSEAADPPAVQLGPVVYNEVVRATVSEPLLTLDHLPQSPP